jgi:VanZ family protein
MYLENNQVRHFPVRAVIAWICVAAWMTVIFCLSHQPADQSGQLSTGLAEQLLLLVRGEVSTDQVEAFDGLLRSMAHAFIFLLLGFFLTWALAEISVRGLGNAVLTVLIGLLYAGADELHQGLVAGRASQWSDFFTDGLGILVAVLMVWIISAGRIRRSRMSKRAGG